VITGSTIGRFATGAGFDAGAAPLTVVVAFETVASLLPWYSAVIDSVLPAGAVYSRVATPLTSGDVPIVCPPARNATVPVAAPLAGAFNDTVAISRPPEELSVTVVWADPTVIWTGTFDAGVKLAFPP
jgi:hypothetical protein